MTSVAEGVRTYLGVISSESILRSTDSGAAFTSALFMLRSQIDASNVIITAESLPEVRADASQLMTVFANLLSNSIKTGCFRSKTTESEYRRNIVNTCSLLLKDSTDVSTQEQDSDWHL